MKDHGAVTDREDVFIGEAFTAEAGDDRTDHFHSPYYFLFRKDDASEKAGMLVLEKRLLFLNDAHLAVF